MNDNTLLNLINGESIKMDSIPLPSFLKGCLWSYDLDALDAQKDFKRIATNILIYGNVRQVNWLFDNFPKKQIHAILTDPLKGDWDKKSLNFWSNYFKVIPDKQKALKKSPQI